jgi:2'-5' RNA ligase
MQVNTVGRGMWDEGRYIVLPSERRERTSFILLILTVRAFIAIELPEVIKQGLAKAQQQLKGSGAGAAWTRSEGIHLTLKFLGEVPDAKVPEIKSALTMAVRGKGRLRIEVAGAGAFPNVKNPRVLWIGVSGDMDALAALQSSVEDAMAGLGFDRETRKFSPHLTLARIKYPRPGDNWQKAVEGIKDVKIGEFEADSVNLMKSELKPSGAVYTEIERVEL